MTWRIIEHVPSGDVVRRAKYAYNVWVNDDTGDVVQLAVGEHPGRGVPVEQEVKG